MPELPVQRRKEQEDKITNSVSNDGPMRSVPKIVCLIVTSPKYHATRAAHVLATWARHCSRAVFLTSENDPMFPEAVVVSEASGYNDLWEKVTRGMITFINHVNTSASQHLIFKKK